MKRAIEEDEPKAKKQEVEKTEAEPTEATEPKEVEESKDESKNEPSEPKEPKEEAKEPKVEPKAEPKEPSAPQKGTPASTSLATPSTPQNTLPNTPKPNPLFSGAFGSFGKSQFGAFGSVGSAASTTTTPKANPWAEPEPASSTEASPWAEKQEEKEASSEPEEKQDKFAVVSLEKQQTKTGEEQEQTLFKTRSKLYCLNLKNTLEGWKERGVGTLHLNIDEAQQKQRILMRADTLFKVILNVTLSKTTEIHKGFQSSAHAAKFVRVTTTEQGELLQFAFRLQTPELADEFYGHLESLIKN